MEKRYIENEQPGFFDIDETLEKVSAMGDILMRLNEVIDWNIFTPILEQLPRQKAKGPGGRPAYREDFLFRILVLQKLHNLSDQQTQFQILDRHSFKRFLGLCEADQVPDQNTIWLFREKLIKADLLEKLFARFYRHLETMGMVLNDGQIVDATIIEVPRQRNKPEHNEEIKNGKIPEEWKENQAKLRQKDTDARWTKKRNTNYYGYKNHIVVDAGSKLIKRYKVTSAEVHDKRVLEELLEHNDPPTYADSAYGDKECQEVYERKNIEAQINERGYRNKPLSKKQNKANRKKSKVRSRVEHPFAQIKCCMKNGLQRYIGIIRNEASIILTNLIYNIVRYEQIWRMKKA